MALARLGEHTNSKSTASFPRRRESTLPLSSGEEWIPAFAGMTWWVDRRDKPGNDEGPIWSDSPRRHHRGLSRWSREARLPCLAPDFARHGETPGEAAGPKGDTARLEDFVVA